MMRQKTRKRILHIENNVHDRDAVEAIFAPEVSLCSKIFHPGSPDLVNITDLVQFVRDHRNETDFIILDLGLETDQENAIRASMATGAGAPDVFGNYTGGIALLDALLRGKVFPAERIAVYTQFDPGWDMQSNVTSVGRDRWGATIQAFYKNTEGREPYAARDLKNYVEQQCGVRTRWMYYFTTDLVLAQTIEQTIKRLDDECETDLVLPFPERDLIGAPERYSQLFKKHLFSVAIIDLYRSSLEDRAIIDEVNKTTVWRNILNLSTITLIQTIERLSRQQTPIIALAKSDFTHGMIRELMDESVGVDLVVNLELLDLNIFSTLWRVVRRSPSGLAARGATNASNN